jgi:hypothetical protein
MVVVHVDYYLDMFMLYSGSHSYIRVYAYDLSLNAKFGIPYLQLRI